MSQNGRLFQAHWELIYLAYFRETWPDIGERACCMGYLISKLEKSRWSGPRTKAHGLPEAFKQPAFGVTIIQLMMQQVCCGFIFLLLMWFLIFTFLIFDVTSLSFTSSPYTVIYMIKWVLDIVALQSYLNSHI
jgi:hypothetical protein